MNPLGKVIRYSLRDPATLLGTAVNTATRQIPCKGASQVVFRVKSTSATQTITGTSVEISNDSAASPLLTLSSSGQNYNVRQSLGGTRLDRGGLTVLVVPTDVGVFIKDDYMRLVVTAVTGGASPTNDITGFEVTAEVYYAFPFYAEMNQLFATIPGVPASMAFGTHPTTVAAAATISPAVTVRVVDPTGAVVIGASVSLTLSGTGTLTGGGAVLTDASGIATFAGLSVSATGGKNLIAACGAIASVTSGFFTVT